MRDEGHDQCDLTVRMGPHDNPIALGSRKEPSGEGKHAVRRLYVGFAGLLLMAVLAQFYLAAVGGFDTAPKDEAFAPHRALGFVLIVLALLATLIGALIRIPGRLIGLTSLVAGLVVVQSVIRVVADAFGESGDASTAPGRVVFGLHALNGLAILAAAGTALRGARALAAVDTSAETTDEAEPASRSSGRPQAHRSEP